MRTLATVLFLAATAAAFNEDNSESANTDFGNASNSLIKGDEGSEAEEFLEAFDTAQKLWKHSAEDIPGIGIIIARANKLNQLAEAQAWIHSLVYDMRNNLTTALQQIAEMKQFASCFNAVDSGALDVSNANHAFFQMQDTMMNGTDSDIRIAQQTFVEACGANKCYDALSNILDAINGVDSSCDVLEAMYNHGGSEGYVGYRDFIQFKATHLLQTAQAAAMQLVAHRIIDEDFGASEDEALDSVVHEFGDRLVNAAGRTIEYVQKAIDETSNTWQDNGEIAKQFAALETQDEQDMANRIVAKMHVVYPDYNFITGLNHYKSVNFNLDWEMDDGLCYETRQMYNDKNILLCKMPYSATTPDAYLNWSRPQELVNEKRLHASYIAFHIYYEGGCGGAAMCGEAGLGLRCAYNKEHTMKKVSGRSGDCCYFGAGRDCWPSNEAPTEFLQ